jgi:Fic family protein
MIIPPPFTITNAIVSLLAKIEANKTALNLQPMQPQIIQNLTRISLLKSSVYSANIEGNTLTPDDVSNDESLEEKNYERQEIDNIIKALSYLRDKNISEVIDMSYLLHLHKLVMHKLIPESQAGKIRNQSSAIFDGSGNVVYMTPPPSEIMQLLQELLEVINNENTYFPLIKAPFAHLIFEKIHPFTDGNGRVGRLLLQAILAKHGYHFQWLLAYEEILAQKKQTYYTLLEQNDATEFVTFLLEVIHEESEKLKAKVATISKSKTEDFLLPRRREILEIIKDHQMISFEQIQRRFLKVPARTLRYDIKQLEKEGFVDKIGATRGVLYRRKGLSL